MHYELKSSTFAADMIRKTIIFSLLMLLSGFVYAQEEDFDELPQEPVHYKLKLQRFRYVKPLIEDGDTVWCYLLPELWVYPPLKFKSEKQRKAYNRLVNNVKKVLPIAQQASALLEETYVALEALPNQTARAGGQNEGRKWGQVRAWGQDWRVLLILVKPHWHPCRRWPRLRR